MLIEKFLTLGCDDQICWIKENYTDYEMDLYRAQNYLGATYPLSDDMLQEYVDYRDDYGTVELIQKKLTNLTVERSENLRDGAELNPREKTALAKAISESDVDGWIGHHSLPISFKNGDLLAYFRSEGIGQGGFVFHFIRAYKHKSELEEYVRSLPYFGVAIGHLLSFE